MELFVQMVHSWILLTICPNCEPIGFADVHGQINFQMIIDFSILGTGHYLCRGGGGIFFVLAWKKKRDPPL